MRELRVSLTDEQQAVLADCRRMLMTSSDTGTIGPVLFFAQQALQQIAGGQVPLVSLEKMQELDGLLRVELAKVGANIQDDTTDPAEPRVITVTLKLTPYPDREGAMMESFSSVKVPKTAGPISEVRFGPRPEGQASPVDGQARPVQLSLVPGADWIVATDGEQYESHPCDWPLPGDLREDGSPVWTVAEGPMIRPEAEHRAAQLNGREVSAHYAYPAEPVIWRAKPGALPPASSPSLPRGKARRAKGSAGGEAGGKARKEKP